jgi:hypothetical protein
MLELHDRTRRRITLAAFCALCLAPTLVVGAWCVMWRGPWHVWAESQRLGRQLGMDVALAGVRHPQPGVIVYEGLRLSDPETGQEVLHAATLQATWTAAIDAQGQRPAIVLAAPQVEVEAAGAGSLWQLVQRHLRLQYGRPEMEVRVKLGELSVRGSQPPLAFSEAERDRNLVTQRSQGGYLSGAASITATGSPASSFRLVNIAGGIGALPGGVQAIVSFHFAGQAAGEPLRVRLVRNRQLRPPTNRIELDTGGAPLPSPLLAALEQAGAAVDIPRQRLTHAGRGELK